MIIRHLGKFVAISFAPRDWNQGEPCRAKKGIDFIKSLPAKARRYNPKKKEWIIEIGKIEQGKMNEIFKLNTYPKVPGQDTIIRQGDTTESILGFF